MVILFKLAHQVLSIKFFRYFAPIACIALISYISFVDFSSTDIDKIEIPFFDKFVHFIMYFSLSYVLLETRLLEKKKYNLFAVLFSILYGIFTEVMQQFIFTYRSGDILDFIFDFSGTILGYIIFIKMTAAINK